MSDIEKNLTGIPLPPEIENLITQGRAQYAAQATAQYDMIIKPYVNVIRSLVLRLSQVDKKPENRAQRRAKERTEKKQGKDSNKDSSTQKQQNISYKQVKSP